MERTSFPVVFRHEEAVTQRDGGEASLSVLPQIAVLLVARGADRVIVPAPDDQELTRVMSGVDAFPVGRTALVRVADSDGGLLARVIDYLSPLSHQASKWPEDAFTRFAVPFLYEVVLGLKYRAGILSDSASVVRSFVSIIDPTEFRGEARFRLAELCRLICSYEPVVIEQGLYEANAPKASTTNALRIMETAEFRGIVAQSAGVGYLRNPIPALRELKHRFVELIRNPLAKNTVRLASTAADSAGAAGAGATAARMLELFASEGSDFNPTFLSLGPAQLSLYRTVLREGLPGSAPPPGTIMTFKSRSGMSWLNEGEETKLEDESQSGIEDRMKKHREALAALDGLVG